LAAKYPQKSWIKKGINILFPGKAIAAFLRICPDIGADATKLNLESFSDYIEQM
jgi:hypothetical protein